MVIDHSCTTAGFHTLAAAGVRGVVAFADPLPRLVGGQVVVGGHVGTVYQALNARFTGRATPRTLTVLANGTVLHDRAQQKIRGQERGHEAIERRLVTLGARAPRAGQRPAEWLAQAVVDIGGRRIRHRGCLRFAFALGTTRRQRAAVTIALPGLAYPKSPDLLVG